MKQLFFSIIVVLTTFACSKQEVDCSSVRSKCTYILSSYSSCSPVGGEYGWKWDHIRYDTITIMADFGCPDEIMKEFYEGEERIKTLPETREESRKFMELYPSTCNCE